MSECLGAIGTTDPFNNVFTQRKFSENEFVFERRKKDKWFFCFNSFGCVQFI